MSTASATKPLTHPQTRLLSGSRSLVGGVIGFLVPQPPIIRSAPTPLQRARRARGGLSAHVLVPASTGPRHRSLRATRRGDRLPRRVDPRGAGLRTRHLGHHGARGGGHRPHPLRPRGAHPQLPTPTRAGLSDRDARGARAGEIAGRLRHRLHRTLRPWQAAPDAELRAATHRAGPWAAAGRGRRHRRGDGADSRDRRLARPATGARAAAPGGAGTARAATGARGRRRADRARRSHAGIRHLPRLRERHGDGRRRGRGDPSGAGCDRSARGERVPRPLGARSRKRARAPERRAVARERGGGCRTTSAICPCTVATTCRS